MSKKLFTLIYGDRVHLSPDSKIIKANTFSKTLGMTKMINTVKEEAEQYRVDVTTECETIREQAYKEGFTEGFKEWAEQLSFLETEIVKVREDLEKILTPVAIKATQKIVGKELETSKETVVSIVANVLKSVAQHKKITVYANPKDLEILDENRPQLREIFETLESLSLGPREDIEPGGCIIETEGGIINAKLDNQWKVLQRAFTTLFSSESLQALREKAIMEEEEDS